MPRPIWLHSSLLLVSALIGPSAGAQWPGDPGQNLAIADRPSEQVVPKIAGTSDGGLYVGWFDLASGNYDVYLQRLDRNGVEQWPHNGILVSAHPQNTSLVDWDLIADSSGSAVLVFTDIRAGGDLDVYAYRVSPAGQMLWGADGVALSINGDFEPAPRVAEASDGDFVFVWPRLPDVGSGSIWMQRLAPDGAQRFPAGGIPVVTPVGERPAFSTIVAAEGGSVIVAWVRDTTTFQSPRHIRAQKFSTTGATLWPVVAVFDATSVPIAYTPRLEADGQGGAIVLWHRSTANLYNSFVQHLDSSGAEVFPHNGIAVSTEATRHHIDPALAYDRGDGHMVVVWNERNSNQSQWGIYAQRLSPAGTRLWGGAGVELLPVNTVWKSFPRCAPLAGGAVVFLLDEPSGQFGRDRVIGMRLDANGAQVWPGSPIVVSSVLSGKARLPTTIDAYGASKLVWEDDRGGTVDVYGQSVNADGTLGAPPAAVGGPVAPAVGPDLIRSQPNPFTDRTVLTAVTDGWTSDPQVEIFDAAGRLVRRLDAAGRGGSVLAWDGRGERGQRLAAGTYVCRVTWGGGRTAAVKATLAR